VGHRAGTITVHHQVRDAKGPADLRPLINANLDGNEHITRKEGAEGGAELAGMPYRLAMQRQEGAEALVPEMGAGSQLAVRLGVDDTPARYTMIAASPVFAGQLGTPILTQRRIICR